MPMTLVTSRLDRARSALDLGKLDCVGLEEQRPNGEEEKICERRTQLPPARAACERACRWGGCCLERTKRLSRIYHTDDEQTSGKGERQRRRRERWTNGHGQRRTRTISRVFVPLPVPLLSPSPVPGSDLLQPRRVDHECVRQCRVDVPTRE